MPRPKVSVRWMQECRDEITLLYVIEDWKSEEVKAAMETQHLGPDCHLSMDQWKRQLRDLKIYKNLSGAEVMDIRKDLSSVQRTFQTLIFADGVLMDEHDVNNHFRRRRKETKGKKREITYTRLPFALDVLDQPPKFQSFQRLLFYTRIHFEKSFVEGKWNLDKRGLYARSPDRRAELAILNNLHNTLVHALGEFKKNNIETGSALTRNAFHNNKQVVKCKHHRQFSDILAILLILQRNNAPGIQKSLTNNLFDLAKQNLSQNEPQRMIFESLPILPLDAKGHLFLAYDAYCRDLWKQHTKDEGIKSIWSYNQASFPRASPGKFFDVFKGATPDEIKVQLCQLDEELGHYSHEMFSMWHMVAQWFRSEKKFAEMQYFLQLLCTRVYSLRPEFDYQQDPQLNFNCMMSFSLLGDA